MKLSFRDYKNACLETPSVHNPCMFWNRDEGFYIGSGLIPNGDLIIHRHLGSVDGSRFEYKFIGPVIRTAIRKKVNLTSRDIRDVGDLLVELKHRGLFDWCYPFEESGYGYGY
jgi:hypothetical protein